jgi:hypothetical protein
VSSVDKQLIIRVIMQNKTMGVFEEAPQSRKDSGCRCTPYFYLFFKKNTKFLTKTVFKPLTINTLQRSMLRQPTLLKPISKVNG